jgi:membrane-bound inhibitor of C-type lysozyme
MKISYSTVTWYSQIVAIILFVAVFFFGFYIGGKYNEYTAVSFPIAVKPAINASRVSLQKLVNNVTFFCPAGTFIVSQFLDTASGKSFVDLELSDGRALSLPQVISADGGRYANPSGSFVFWNKGSGAFIQENGTTTYSGCVTH